MIVVLNGEHRELPAGSTVASVVSLISAASDARGVAVAVHGEVVPRTAWASTALVDGAWVEVVAAIQGG